MIKTKRRIYQHNKQNYINKKNVIILLLIQKMYLDRNDISFRKEDEKDLLSKEQITIFRPGNRIYPKERWYISGEVVKARVINIPWNDNEKKLLFFQKPYN